MSHTLEALPSPTRMRRERAPLWIEIRQNYGRRAIYPKNDAAKMVARIANKFTLDAGDIGYCRALGFDVVIDATEADAQKLCHELNEHAAIVASHFPDEGRAS